MSNLTTPRKPCHECPFRRIAPAGYLGNNVPEVFAELAINEPSIACHTTVDQTLKRPEWERDEAAAPRCRGALTLMRNECKLPREPQLAALAKTVPPDRENVFANRREFVQFHRAAPVHSWTEEDEEDIFEDE